MNQAKGWLAGLILLGILGFTVPVGIAIAESWTPNHTTTLIGSGAGVLGAFAVILAAAIGVGITRRKNEDSGDGGGGYVSSSPSRVIDNRDINYLKAREAELRIKKAEIELAQREQNMRQLPAPDPNTQWYEAQPGFLFDDPLSQPARRPASSSAGFPLLESPDEW